MKSIGRVRFGGPAIKRDTNSVDGRGECCVARPRAVAAGPDRGTVVVAAAVW